MRDFREHCAAGKHVSTPSGVPPMHSRRQVGHKFLSELTAEYPESLAHSMASIFAPFVTAQGKQNASIADFADLLPETYVPHRMTLCDGAGMNSHADHTFAKQSKLETPGG